jgi:ADP-heptose:LPS heptosyltransferase
MSRTPRVLVLRGPGLGDLLTVVPALRAIRDAFPRHRVELATPAALRPVAELTGAVDALVDVAPLQPVPAWARRPDVAVNLQGAGPQSHRVLLAAEPGRLVAFRHPAVPASDGMPAWRDDEHQVVRWCRLLSESGIPADPRRLDLAPPGGEDVPSGLAVVHPGATRPARRWPAARWAAVARRLDRAGFPVVVTGNDAEAPLARSVARTAGLAPDAVLAGRTSLKELAALVAGARLVLCGDTGVAHLASAFATPSVVLFGPMPPSRWGPPPRPIHRVLWKGRTRDPHAARPDPGLLRISVDEVLDQAFDLLDLMAAFPVSEGAVQ